MVAPLYSYFCCFCLDIVPVPLLKHSLAQCQTLSKYPQMAPGRVQYWLVRELQVFPLVVTMSSPPSAPKWALARGFTHPGGLHPNGCTRARNWTLGGGVLYVEAKGISLQHCGHHLITMTQQNQSTSVGTWTQLQLQAHNDTAWHSLWDMMLLAQRVFLNNMDIHCK